MSASLSAGRPVEVEEVASLADSLGGGIGLDNRFTFDLCRDLLDETVLVGEADIYHAMQALYHEERMVAEGAGVVGLAAVFSGKVALSEGPAATIITGRNLDMATFTRIVSGEPVTLGGTFLEGRRYGA